jgi:hypothetical protein
MQKSLDIVAALSLMLLLVLLPIYIATISSDHTKVGVLCYTFTNTQKTALRF